MYKLWQRTVDAIRQYPTLCLPVIWASVLAYGWGQLRFIAQHELTPFLFQTHVHSVLGSETVFAQPGSAQYAIGIVVLGLISVAMYFANACCFFVAFLMIAKILQRYTVGESHVKLFRWQVARLSLLFVMAAMLLSAFIMFLFASLTQHLHRTSLLTAPTILTAELLPLSLILAYLFTSPSMRLLGRELGTHVSAQAIGQARVCSAMAVVFLTILTVGATQIHLLDYPTFPERVATALFLAIADSLPYIPLFVAMSLLGMEAGSTAQDLGSEGSPHLAIGPPDMGHP